ncbi:MAG: hypothetical protein ACP5NV_00315 [Candidatus Woesearchaeota archaeon]
MDELQVLKDKVSKFRHVEAGIWNFLNEDPINHSNILKEHGKLQAYITELYTEITTVGKEHDLFEHMKTDSGRNVAELLRVLRLYLVHQYDDLLKLKDAPDREAIRKILDGNKNGMNESETSQKIKQVELELMNVKLIDFVKVSVFGKEISVEKKSSDEDMYFDESLELLRSKGYSRHLMPSEYFELLATKNDVFNFKYEWVNMLVKVMNGQLYVAFNPEKVTRKNNGYDINGGNSFSVPIGEMKLGTYNEYSFFPDELKKFVGSRCKGLFIRSDADNWWPVGSNYGGIRFGLYAYNGRGASRGVK